MYTHAYVYIYICGGLKRHGVCVHTCIRVCIYIGRLKRQGVCTHMHTCVYMYS